MAASGLPIPVTASLSIYEGHKAQLEIKEAVYRIDAKTGKMEMVTDEAVQAQRPVLLARLQEALSSAIPAPRTIPTRRNHQGFSTLWTAESLRNGREFINMEIERQGSGSRRWHPRRRRRQYLDGRRLGGPGLRRRPRIRAGRGAHRDDPAAGDLRQCLLRRNATEPAVYGGQPVVILGVRGDYRSAHRLNWPRMNADERESEI